MTVAGRMREAAKQIKRFDLKELCDVMDIRTYAEQRLVKVNIKDFLKRGEFKRLSPGRYLYVAKEQKTTLRQRLWDIARRMTYFSPNDLEQITEGNLHTIRDFCKWVVRDGYAERIERGKYRTVGRLTPDVPKEKKRK